MKIILSCRVDLWHEKLTQFLFPLMLPAIWVFPASSYFIYDFQHPQWIDFFLLQLWSWQDLCPHNLPLLFQRQSWPYYVNNTFFVLCILPLRSATSDKLVLCLCQFWWTVFQLKCYGKQIRPQMLDTDPRYDLLTRTLTSFSFPKCCLTGWVPSTFL